jgi:hypothetical protein
MGRHPGKAIAQSESRQGEIVAVCIHEDAVLLAAKERMEDALRYAEQRRALRAAHPPRRPLRFYLGMALVRLGHWIMGHPTPAPGSPIGLPQAQS